MATAIIIAACIGWLFFLFVLLFIVVKTYECIAEWFALLRKKKEQDNQSSAGSKGPTGPLYQHSVESNNYSQLKKPSSVTYMVLANAILRAWESKHGTVDPEIKSAMFVAFEYLSQDDIDEIYAKIKEHPVAAAYLAKQVVETFKEKQLRGERMSLLEIGFIAYIAKNL